MMSYDVISNYFESGLKPVSIQFGGTTICRVLILSIKSKFICSQPYSLTGPLPCHAPVIPPKMKPSTRLHSSLFYPRSKCVILHYQSLMSSLDVSATIWLIYITCFVTMYLALQWKQKTLYSSISSEMRKHTRHGRNS